MLSSLEMLSGRCTVLNCSVVQARRFIDSVFVFHQAIKASEWSV